MMDEEVLLEAELVPDPDEAQEMGSQVPQLIGDQELRGCRFLLVRRTAEPFKTDSLKGLAVELACTFQPAPNTRFSWAQIVLNLVQPTDANFLDVGPEAVRESEPVRFTFDSKGKLGVKYVPLSAEMEESAKQEFSVYHCDIQGSGASTKKARWDFRENPHTLQGLGRNQSLTFLLPEAPHFAFQASMSARIVRGGLNGVIESARSLISGPNVASYAVELDFPAPQPSRIARFLFG
jgi:hypothetical protein